MEGDGAGMSAPRIMLYPAINAIEIHEDRITLRPDWSNVERVVWMDGRSHPSGGERTPQGHSFGRWEGDTLVGETNRINYPYLSDTGFPQSQASRIIERFALGDGDTRLTWTATVIDPETFTEPVALPVIHHEWKPDGEVRPFGCNVLDPEG